MARWLHSTVCILLSTSLVLVHIGHHNCHLYLGSYTTTRKHEADAGFWTAKSHILYFLVCAYVCMYMIVISFGPRMHGRTANTDVNPDVHRLGCSGKLITVPYI